MHDDTFTYSANISVMFTEHPLLDRPRAAAAAGFDDIEMWWPFEQPVVENAQLRELAAAISQAGVALRGLNFYAGDMPGGERGVASIPDRAAELRANTAALLELAEATGCRSFNLLYGQRDARFSQAEQDSAALASLQRAATAVASIGGTVLLEPLAKGHNGDYPLTDPEQVVDLLRGPLAHLPNVKLLFDLFHLGSNGFDIVGGVPGLIQWIGHVQVADSPGRGEPGTGTLPIVASLDSLANAGYEGLIACEYRPTVRTEDSLTWIDGHAA
ncbi:hydroxypyruvate isomerase family protein [Ruania alba]|uniref:Hydroxypyruvate isomerase n=1 Tax=Ruania alba TaxID=648782 RepID=A0A1H5H6K4_9MICO|nr:TIM barrel protein [Ruania alba]SEE23569.1 hydroxypyruvate isomerase [Ruania alba]